MHTSEKTKLFVQSNGWIVQETRGASFVRHSPARDLVFTIEYKSIEGWHPITSEFRDDITARQVLKETIDRYPKIQWRLRARNEFGSTALPRNWWDR